MSKVRSFLQREADKRHEEFMSHIRQEFVDRREAGHPMTLTEYKELRANSYEREYLRPLYDDETLLHCIAYCVQNCGIRDRYLPSTYDQALVYRLLPMLVGRYKALRAEIRDTAEKPSDGSEST